MLNWESLDITSIVAVGKLAAWPLKERAPIIHIMEEWCREKERRQLGHDTPIGLIPFGAEEGVQSHVGGTVAAVSRPLVGEMNKGVNEAYSISLTHCSYGHRLRVS